jgi:pimeloyl-ACP methyl ester carboxylesterase
MRNLKQLPNGKWTWKYDRVLRTPGRNAKPSPQEVARLWGYLESLTCPTLVVRGVRSDTISEATAAEMAQRIPNARLATVPNAGHLAPGDNPTGFLAVLTDFLGTLSK